MFQLYITISHLPSESVTVQPANLQPVTVIAPTRGLASLQLRAVWQYRELLGFLAWRDIKVRYKQTALGVAWIVLQPLVSTVVFSLNFGGLLTVPSDGAPPAMFALAALVSWQYGSGSFRSGRADPACMSHAVKSLRVNATAP